MAAYIDRRLTEEINMAGEADRVEAVIVVKESIDLCPTVDDGGLVQQVIDSATACTGDLPVWVRYFPRANAAVIVASGKLIQEILNNENLAVASATDVGAIIFD